MCMIHARIKACLPSAIWQAVYKRVTYENSYSHK
jgi:hypothetical protein